MPSIDPSPPYSQRPCPPLPSPPRVSCDLRMVLLSVFLPVTAALALPALGIGALIWWRASKTWDYRERWSGTWLMAAVGLVVYALIIWFGHPLLYALFGGLLSASPVAGPQRLGLLWLLHLCFAPTCALILEGLHPLTRHVRRQARTRVPRRGKARSVSPGHPPASSLSLVPASPPFPSAPLSSPPWSSLQLSSLSQPPVVQPPPTEPLGIFLGG